MQPATREEKMSRTIPKGTPVTMVMSRYKSVPNIMEESNKPNQTKF